jgi:hypothetical protein
MNTTRRRMSTMRSTSSGILWLWALVKSREYGDKPMYVYHILIVERINFSPFLLINHLFCWSIIMSPGKILSLILSTPHKP